MSRVPLDSVDPATVTGSADVADAESVDDVMPKDSLSLERHVGITEYVQDRTVGLSGKYKQRYLDFLVNEVEPSGEVLRLKAVPEKLKVKEGTIKEEDRGKPAEPHIIREHPTGSKSADRFGKSRDLPEDVSKPVIGDQSVSDAVSEPILSVPAISEGVSKPTADDQPIASWKGLQTTESGGTLSSEAELSMHNLVGEENTGKIKEMFIAMNESPGRPKEAYGAVVCPNMTDKDTRTELHVAIRECFKGCLHSEYDASQEAIVVTAAKRRGTKRPHGGDDQRSRNSKRGGGGGGGSDRRGQQDSIGAREEYSMTLNGQNNDNHANGTRPGGFRSSESDLSKRDPESTINSKYIHFTVLKVNRETTDVANFLRKHTPAHVEFRNAGTKDRRGVTVQRFSVCNSSAKALANLARKAAGWTLGDFRPASAQLKLGELQGNEFQIVLRDVRLTGNTIARWVDGADTTSKLIDQAAKAAADSITNRGFINYFGLQRFGTGKVHTDTTGIHMLQGDYRSAVDTILSFDSELLAGYNDPELRERNKMDYVECKRAFAISMFKGGSVDVALKEFPRRASQEYDIMKHLAKHEKGQDFLGALRTIPHNTMMLYMHAYQSRIWNLLASYRYRQHGAEVVQGDLVLVKEHPPRSEQNIMPVSTGGSLEDFDQDGEPVIRPHVDDRSVKEEKDFLRARALEPEEVNSGEFSIHDIVLPLPGYDVIYPEHLKRMYIEVMGREENGGLDPFNMHRDWKLASLPGTYRKLMARPTNGIDVHVEEYTDDNHQFLETDFHRIEREEHVTISGVSGFNESVDKGETAIQEEANATKKVALVLKFALGVSTYATMLLREMLVGGLHEYQKEYSKGTKPQNRKAY